MVKDREWLTFFLVFLFKTTGFEFQIYSVTARIISSTELWRWLLSNFKFHIHLTQLLYWIFTFPFIRLRFKYFDKQVLIYNLSLLLFHFIRLSYWDFMNILFIFYSTWLMKYVKSLNLFYLNCWDIWISFLKNEWMNEKKISCTWNVFWISNYHFIISQLQICF